MNIFQFFGIESEFEIARIPITQEMKLVAKQYDDDIMNLNKIKETPNYTGLSTNGRYYWGALGELAFTKFLSNRNIGFEWKLQSEGFSDHGDFKIGKKVFDVKTSSKLYSDRLLVSKAQYSAHFADYYVAIKVWDDNAFIFGVVDRKELNEKNVCQFYSGVEDYYVLYDEIKKVKKVK